MLSYKRVCVKCRLVNKPCDPNHEIVTMGYRWRPPKKSNNRAWKMLENGDFWWDKKAINKKALEMRKQYNERAFNGKTEAERLAEAKRKSNRQKALFLMFLSQKGEPGCIHTMCKNYHKMAVSGMISREEYEEVVCKN